MDLKRMRPAIGAASAGASRRAFLSATAIGAVSLLAGCGGGGGAQPVATPSPTPTPTPSPTPTPTPAPMPTPTPTPPPVILSRSANLKLTLGSGRERQIAAIDPVTVGALRNSSSIMGGVAVAKDSASIRRVGSNYLPGVGFPAELYLYPKSATLGDPRVIEGSSGLPVNRGGAGGIEFLLPAGVSQFEFVTGIQGGGNFFAIEIDGVATNDAGYPVGTTGNGDPQYYLVTLTASTVARRIRIWLELRPFFGLVLPAGVTLADPTPAQTSSVIFIGDSIVQGSGATRMSRFWPIQAAYRMGVDNPIVSGAGGSGYLRRFPADTGYNFLDRIDDVLTAVNGRPPDAVMVAGGINDFSVDGTGYTPAQVGPQALTYFRMLRASVPDMPIIVVGPFSDFNNPTYNPGLIPGRDAIFAAAAQVDLTYTIDVSTLVTPANRDVVFGTAANGPHPTDAGHAIYGEFIGNAARAILSRL